MNGARVPAIPQGDLGIKKAMDLFLTESNNDAKLSPAEFEKGRHHAFDVLRGAFDIFQVTKVACVTEKVAQLEKKENSPSLSAAQLCFLALYYFYVEPSKGYDYLGRATAATPDADLNTSAVNDLTGLMYQHGYGEPANKAEVEYFYQEAANAGYGYAAAQLGKILEVEDRKKSVELYKRAIELGSPLGCWNLSRIQKKPEDAKKLADEASAKFLETYFGLVEHPIAKTLLQHYYIAFWENQLLKAMVTYRLVYYCQSLVGWNIETFALRPPRNDAAPDAKHASSESHFTQRYHASLVLSNDSKQIMNLAKENPDLFFDLLKHDLMPSNNFKEKNFRHIFVEESPAAKELLEQLEVTVGLETYRQMAKVLNDCKEEQDLPIMHRIRANLARAIWDESSRFKADVQLRFLARAYLDNLNAAYLSPDENAHVGNFLLHERNSILNEDAKQAYSYPYLKRAAESNFENTRNMLIRSAIPREAKLEELPVEALLSADIKFPDTYQEFSQHVRTVLKSLIENKSARVAPVAVDHKVSAGGMFGATAAAADAKVTPQQLKVFENCMRDLKSKIDIFRIFFINAVSGSNLQPEEQIKFRLLKTLYDLITKPVPIDVEEKEYLENILAEINTKLGVKPITIEDLNLPDQKIKDELQADDQKKFKQFVAQVQQEIKPSLEAIKPILSEAIQKLIPSSTLDL